MKGRNIPRLIVMLCSLCCTACQANSEEVIHLETKEFAKPSMPWRPIPLWFWNNTQINESALVEQLQKMVEVDGYGGCAILPFGTGFRPNYLSDDYFNLYGAAINKARSLGAHMSIYDEYGFPSGSMGAINGSGVTTFMNNHPGHTIKRLDKTEYRVGSGATFDRQLNISGKLMSLVAWNTNTKEIIPLREFYDEETSRVTWTAPTGSGWRVMLCQCVIDGDPNVDYLSPEAVSLFVQDTHAAYYQHFADDFGQTIVSTFFDEPTMYRAQGRMWTNDFNEQFEARCGFSPETLYPALWYDIGEGTSRARNMLFSLHSTLYSEGFMKTICDWATEHGILTTGHQDQEEIVNPTSVAGDLMLVGKHLTMPGIDKIGNGRNTEDFYKVVSSSANNWDKTYVMSETYGAMGNISVETLYQVAIEQYTKGINHLIPHAVWYNDGDVTFLPELSWRNPLYNADLPSFNAFLSRLNYVLAREGRHVADVAVLYPIQTQYAGHVFDGPKGYYEGGVDVPGTDYPQISHYLTDDLGIDFTYLHPEVIDDRCSVSDGMLNMNNSINHEHFSVIVLPGVRVISLSNLRKIEEAWQQGVKVVFTTQYPQQAADEAGADEEVQSIVARMLNATENKAYFLPTPSAASLAEVMEECLPQRDVIFSEGAHPFNYIHKVIDGHDVWYFGNIDATSATNTIRVKTSATKLALLNPHTGQYNDLSLKGNEVSFSLTLRPNQSIFLVDDALLLKNGSPIDPADEKLSYMIEVEAEIEQLSAGICFSVTNAGSYYMWQFNTSDTQHPRLRPHRWLGGSVSLLGEIELPSEVNIQVGHPFKIRLEIDDEAYVRTYIDDVLVDERGGSFAFGNIGFRQAHDDAYGKTEIALFDDVAIKVKSSSGPDNVVFSENFSNSNPFTDGNIVSGRLRVAGQMSRDILAWLQETPDAISLVPNTVLTNEKRTYNLSGQMINGRLAQGIVVQNGKKYISRK
ncbi:MAG: hypothetical protein J6W03_00410 [Bacteroidaceae bacterium]|nr:hypothetical protein [Bacteroidaceae bacterium]